MSLAERPCESRGVCYSRRMRKRKQITKTNAIPHMLYNQRRKELDKIDASAYAYAYASAAASAYAYAYAYASAYAYAYTSAYAYASAYVEVCKAGVWGINMLVEDLKV